MKTPRLALVLTLAGALGLAGCSAGTSSPGTSPSTETIGPQTTPDSTTAPLLLSTIIDVRTPAEYAEGHLDGAMNIDVQAADFTDRIAALPTDAEYIVYCRTGSRAEAALAQMTALGFTDVTNAGSLADASASTGIAVVSD
ncbi:rhodanese-like domain-containing protein [Cryobacterium sp. SO1]|uniref:rhodanese-like domain-containing protein n=1 Tax=Cryobacterium sp. SO1 TaxID=1897061 RepID=UPI001023539F|nr:rhodanese-like domain-containing protein [Cryobacterium sp. SO1]RZI33984.1 Thiosulfate sulfurtransferase PspE [Cryobacterium sp. SO1]